MRDLTLPGRSIAEKQDVMAQFPLEFIQRPLTRSLSDQKDGLIGERHHRLQATISVDSSLQTRAPHND